MRKATGKRLPDLRARCQTDGQEEVSEWLVRKATRKRVADPRHSILGANESGDREGDERETYGDQRRQRESGMATERRGDITLSIARSLFDK